MFLNCSDVLGTGNSGHSRSVGKTSRIPAKSRASVRLLSIARTMTSPTTELKDYLAHSKERYLNAVKDGRGGEWTVVMGNEAGGKAVTLFYPSCSNMPW